MGEEGEGKLLRLRGGHGRKMAMRRGDGVTTVSSNVTRRAVAARLVHSGRGESVVRAAIACIQRPKRSGTTMVHVQRLWVMLFAGDRPKTT
ncbi:hypothetical protein SESBI_02266 [Sesbania bispinosa]|nr:hypothetical protein SESBI_02266 [Sesbania bispinosa]